MSAVKSRNILVLGAGELGLPGPAEPGAPRKERERAKISVLLRSGAVESDAPVRAGIRRGRTRKKRGSCAEHIRHRCHTVPGISSRNRKASRLHGTHVCSEHAILRYFYVCSLGVLGGELEA